MKTKYLNLLCLLIINVSVLAQTRKQTINGIIKDSQNGESIPYATIISGEYFTTSNSEGSLYPLKYNSHLSLKYLTLGMKPVMS